MKVLFVRSKNSWLDAISRRQGASLRKHGVEVVYYDIIGKGITGYLKNLFPLKRMIRKEKPDLIHAHYSLSGFLATLAFSGHPIVVSLMGSDVLSVNKPVLAITRFCSKFIWKASITKSPEINKKLNNKNSTIIANGVDVDIFRALNKQECIQKLGWDKKYRYIIFASNPDRAEKNFQLASAAFEKIQSSTPYLQLKYLNNLNTEEMVLHYSAADVLVLTSLYEGSPNVIKEAMACNCPIVSTDVGDVRTVIGDTEGCFITDFNVDAVADALLKALEMNERTKGRDQLMKLQLDSDSVAKKIIKIYKGIA